MGSVIQGVTESELRGAARFYINRDDETPYYLELEQLYKRSCTIDPQPESFAQWLDAVRESEWQVSDRAAQAWHEALPKDSRPLLFLMKSCEERKALRKALKYLEQAEAAESMNPDVRRARLRLWFSTAERHLGQKKPHLARKDFDEIEKLPQLEGDRVAYLRALQMICSALEDDLPETNRISDDLKAEYGSAFRYILYRRASTIAKLDCIDVESEYALPICKEISRALELSRDLEKPFETSHAMEGVVLQELQQDKCALDSPSLFLVAETIAESSVFYDSSVAFHASLHGLGRKDELQACFMLLRALSLRYDLSMRAAECAAAAVLMARRRGDTTLAGKAIDLLEDICNMECLDFEAELEDAEYQLKHIIDRETSAKQLTQQTPVKLLRIVPNGRKDTDSSQPDETHEEERGRQGERETGREGDKERGQGEGESPKKPETDQPLLPFFDKDEFYLEEEEEEEETPKAHDDDQGLDDEDDPDDDEGPDYDERPDEEEEMEAMGRLDEMLKDFHPQAAALLLEMMFKHGDTVPESVRKKDPDLFYRLQKAFDKYGMPPLPGEEDEYIPPKRRNSRKRSKRKRRKRKRR
jgi:hypothetical protein